uniref:hypothetical protein n=1 Tax=Shewanella sp. TaxID=50422 RepID=UPI0040478734
MPQSLLPNILSFISQIDPFDKIDKAELRALCTHVKISYLGKGERVDLAEEDKEKSLYIVRTGSMEQRKTDGVKIGYFV